MPEQNGPKYKVRGWDEFQHYKDRNPPWIKLHFSLLSSEDWVELDDASRVLAIACLLIASRHDGYVPDKPTYIQRVAYLNHKPDFKPLIDCGFLLPDSKCKQMLADASEVKTRGETEERRDRGETEECPELPAEATEPPVFELPTNRYPTTGEQAPISNQQIQEWAEAYPAVDIMQELRKAKAWLNNNPKKRKTLSGMPKFINSWLSRTQDRGVTPNGQADDKELRRQRLIEATSGSTRNDW